MRGCCLCFYVQEKHKHHHRLMYEWLLEQAKKLGIHGGSVFRAIAGYGRHGVLHEDHFFELQGDLPVKVVFVLSDDEAEKLLAVIEAEGVALFFTRAAVTFGITGEIN